MGLLVYPFLEVTSLIALNSGLSGRSGFKLFPTLPFINFFRNSFTFWRRAEIVLDSETGPSMSTAPIMTELFTVASQTRWPFPADLSKISYNILEKRKWRTLAEEKNTLLEAKDKEIEDLKSQLLRAREESAEVTQLRAQVSGLEATENSLRGNCFLPRTVTLSWTRIDYKAKEVRP
ncbi:hypothetical protein Tco_0502633 [Tanacetum coccineum]